MSQFECEIHGDYFGKPILGFGKRGFIKPPCPACTAIEDSKREALEETERRNKIKRIFESSGIPKRHLECTFVGYHAKNKSSNLALSATKKYAELFEKIKELGGSLVLCGKPGTGKTHLACAIANEIMNRGIPVKYTTAFKTFSDIKSTYSKNSSNSEKEIIDSLIAPQLLIIDEVGMQFGSDTEKIILFQVINGRYENVLPTILVSNLPEKELSNYIGERCLDRMREGGGAVIAFDWDSYRK